jgi:hypothetical protein
VVPVRSHAVMNLQPDGATAILCARSEALSNPKVLVADDERIIADTLVMILDNSGFDARAGVHQNIGVKRSRRQSAAV